jgi:hypothetical protein
MDTDTDVLLAIAASLLPDDDGRDQASLLDALLKANGDPVAAADLVRKRATKRSRGLLDDWVSTKIPAKSPRTSLAHAHPRSNADHNTSSTSSPVQLPPVLLSDPAQIASQTPCTLHASVLPPKLATMLYYDLVDKSVHWKPNKWWLFDRLVESPHKTTFLVRKDPRSAIWEEAAQLWYTIASFPLYTVLREITGTMDARLLLQIALQL